MKLRICGAVLAGLGTLSYVSSFFLPLNKTPQWYLTVLAFVVSGAVCLALSFRHYLPHVEKDVEPYPLEPSKKEKRDMDCIYYLSNRARSYQNKEALKLMEEFENLMYIDRHKMGDSDEKTGVNTVTGTVLPH